MVATHVTHVLYFTATQFVFKTRDILRDLKAIRYRICIFMLVFYSYIPAWFWNWRNRKV